MLSIAAAMVPSWQAAVLLWGGALTGYISIDLIIVLQNTTNREMAALHAKIDELIRVNRKARDELIGLEEKTAEEIKLARGV